MSSPSLTLLEVIRELSDPQVAHEFFVSIRWPNGAWCPREGCGSTDVARIGRRNVWRCRECNRQFTAKVGTIFEDSPIGFDKWLPAMWMLAGDRNGTSSYEISRKLGVTQKTAWFMDHRIRLAMKSGSFEKLQGPVEIDETYIGGKATSTDRNPETGKLMPTGPQENKAIVMGMVERKGCVRVAKVSNVQKKTLKPIIEKNITPGATVYTDALSTYNDLDKTFEHYIINHTIEYVRGHVHTNTIENFWACLKRTINGTYTYVSVEHLDRYLDEQAFRHNNKEAKDADRLRLVLRGVEGRRILYKQLTATVSAKKIATRGKQRIAAIKWRAMKAQRRAASLR